MRVMIVGAGYVGLSMGVVLGTKHDVTLVEVDASKAESINRMIPPIYEIGLPELLNKAVTSGKLKALTPSEGITKQDVVMICVQTPPQEDGSVDLSYVEQAIKQTLDRIDDICDDYCIVTIKSTVPPGTTRRHLLNEVAKRGIAEKVGVAVNPEFLREGTAISDAQKPDRIVIGAEDAKPFEKLKRMYDECLDKGSAVYIEVGLESAELIKYVNNSFLAMKISFANEIANITESLQGADVEEVMQGIGLDRRINPSFFGAGAGYGGSCFPKDVEGLIRFAEDELGLKATILRATQSVNNERPAKLVNMLLDLLGDIHGKKISVLGLAFKPGTNDIRESPSLIVIQQLCELGANVCAHDPLLDRMQLSGILPQDVSLTKDLESCLKDSSGCILVTDWEDYKQPGLHGLTKNMKTKVFIDGRRVFTESDATGIVYRTVGSSSSTMGE